MLLADRIIGYLIGLRTSQRGTATIPLPWGRDSPHRLTVESPEISHLAGVVQR